MNIADKMIDYEKTRDDSTFGLLPTVAPDNMIVIVIEILSWLKLERKREIWQEQGRKTNNKPMKLNLNYPWCNDLVRILGEDNQIADVFCVENNNLIFRKSISDDYIHEARIIAYEKYNPQMIIG